MSGNIPNIFLSGSCRILYTVKDGCGFFEPVHSMAYNFLGRLHNTKQHIQFIRWLKDEIEIPDYILKCFLNAYHKQDIDDWNPSIPNHIKKQNIKNLYDTCKLFIFEISSIKIYKHDNFYVQYELTNTYETQLQTEEDLLNDLYILRNLISANIPIIFQTHFRPNIIYNNLSKTIEKREMIYNVLNKFSQESKYIYIYDPSIILKSNNSLFDGDVHFTLDGYIKSFDYLYNKFIITALSNINSN